MVGWNFLSHHYVVEFALSFPHTSFSSFKATSFRRRLSDGSYNVESCREYVMLVVCVCHHFTLYGVH